MKTPEGLVKPRILIAPLDWGLGHATRCVPVIQELLNNGCTIFLSGEGKIEALLKREFPELPFLPLKGYNIQYGKTGLELFGKMLLQIPKMIEAMDEEHEWLENTITEHCIDAVISDNRYGLFSERIPSVFITHQLLIKTSLGNTADKLLQKLNYEYINAFSECWVPDVEDPQNLSGDLSHPEKKPTIPVHYVGALSRFDKKNETAGKHLLIQLSGPEPQRTIFEDMLLEQLSHYNEPVVFVRGLPDAIEKPLTTANISFVNHLPGTELKEAIESAHFVISRCGYSTVMDLMALGKKSILIPTPGQTEQEYLAQHLMKHNLALCIPQSKFRLKNTLDLAELFNYRTGDFASPTKLKEVVAQFVKRLEKGLSAITPEEMNL